MKNKIFLAFTILLISSFSTGCASIENKWERNSLNIVNKSATIECWSGGKVIYSVKSDGKVTDSPSSDGFFFKKENGDFVEINADCVITYDK